MIRLLATPDEIDALLRAHEPPGWSGENVLRRGSRVWGFDRGAFICEPLGDGALQLHVRVLEGTPYRHAVECGRLAILQETTAGCSLVGITPKPNKRALHFALACGMKFMEENEKEWWTCRLK